MLEKRIWEKNSPAYENDLVELMREAPCDLPASYIELLKYGNGGQGPLSNDPYYFILYSVDEVLRIFREKTFEKFFAGLFVIGGSGGGDAVAIDFRSTNSRHIVCFDLINTDLEESVVFVAKDFESFLPMIGLEAE